MEETTLHTTKATNENENKNIDDNINISFDDNVAGTNNLNEELSNENEPDKVAEQLAEMNDKYLRLNADFINYKNRTAKEYLDLRLTAGKDIIMNILDVLDDCDRAEKQMKTSTDLASLKEGVDLIFTKLRKVVFDRGVVALETKGKNFDVELHEAITEIPMPKMEGKVIDEVQKGYYMNEKLIRFAKVVVGSKV